MRRVAVIGSGISGLAAAWHLGRQAQVTLFEAGSYFGGHTHTVDVRLEGVRHGVDTGFLVFNHRTYPRLVRLFEQLQVDTAPSDMSFSVQAAGLEWSGSSLNTVFAQRSNLLRPRFLRMLADIVRFNRLATGIATDGLEGELSEPIGDFLARHGDQLRRNPRMALVMKQLARLPAEELEQVRATAQAHRRGVGLEQPLPR